MQEKTSAPAPAAPRDELGEWKARLLDLTLRSPLLNMREGARLVRLPEPATAAMLLLEQDAGRMSVPPDEAEAFAELARLSAACAEQTGECAFYLGLYEVSWVRHGDSDTHEAPLVLVPARVVRGSAAGGLEIAAEMREVRVNMALAEQVRCQLGVDLPQVSSFSDVSELVGQMRVLAGRTSGWEVHDAAFAGLFPLSSAAMFWDLDEHEGKPLRNEVARALSGGVLDQAHRVSAPEGRLSSAGHLLPLPSDSSQLHAVQMAAHGISFVLVGPPGTGKSQTIANMAVDAMARGKSVLVVSKKAAALDVVRERLGEVGLGAFCLPLYGPGQRGKVLSQIRSALECEVNAASGDGGRFAREFTALERELDAYAQALARPVFEGLDVRGAIARFVAVRDASDVVEVNTLTLESMLCDEDVLRAKFLVERMGALASTLGVGSRRGRPDADAALITPTAPSADAQAWRTWHALEDEAAARGLQSATRAVLRGYSADEVTRSFEKALYRALCERALKDDNALRAFSGVVFDQVISQYARMDSVLRQRAAHTVAASLEGRAQATREDGRLAEQVSALKRAVRSGSGRLARERSLRTILREARNAVVGLCPCVLATPADVAQNFAWDAWFDFVVFDEASQLETAEAVGVLERAAQVVVAGDPQQMPPSAFFSASVSALDVLGDEPAAMAYADGSSLLEDCLALGLPRVSLNWHYRSQHESLITFSNNRFYNGKLHTFPSPDARTSKVWMRKVEAAYSGGGVNEAEARAVALHVRERFEAGYAGSVGIITMGLRQQHAVERALDEEFEGDVAFSRWANERPEPLLVRNLENMQGDERDLVLISVAYGPDEHGCVAQRFGPLNLQGGERRLNVAVTRARCEMVVFSSMTSFQVDVGEHAPEGVCALHDFLAYAEVGAETRELQAEAQAKATDAKEAEDADAEDANADDAGADEQHASLADQHASFGDSDSQHASLASQHASSADPLAESLAQALSARGWDVALCVGASDFAVDLAVSDPMDPGRYVLGVLLDGAAYRAAHTTRDRDLGRDEVLSRLGWNLVHVWSLDCLFGFDAVVSRLARQLDALICQDA